MTLAEAQETVALLGPMVRMGLKSNYENGRRQEYDVAAAASQYAAAQAVIAAAQGDRPQVRRVSFVQYGKGL